MVTIPKSEYESLIKFRDNIFNVKSTVDKLIGKGVKEEIIDEIKNMNETDFLDEEQSEKSFEILLKNSMKDV